MAKERLADKWCWECNECGAQEYTMSISEYDVHELNCSNCGGGDWHKASIDKQAKALDNRKKAGA